MDCPTRRKAFEISNHKWKGDLKNLKSEGERERMIIRGDMEEHVRMTNSQIREIMPQFVRQVEAIMGPRDSQIVALGQACEALISNQNFLLQNGMDNLAPIQTPVPPKR